MSNISAADAQGVLKQAAAAIRTLKDENDDLKSKVADHEREEKIASIAKDMEEKSLNSDLDFDEKVAALREAKDLDVTAEAIKMAAPQGKLMGGTPPDGDDGVHGGGTSAFEHFIMTGESSD
jgi:hypothetical protein